MAGGPSAFQPERLRLLGELRRVREAAGLTTRELAARLGVSQSTVVNRETGQRGVRPADVAGWARAAGLPAAEVDELVGLASRAEAEVVNWRTVMRATGPSGMAAIQREWAALEHAAPIFREYQLAVVPGLLQTAEYARQVFAAEEEGDAQDIAAAAAERLDRQAALYNPEKRFEFVLCEAAVRWRVGTPAVHAAQIDRIRQVMTLSNVDLGIIPMDVVAPIWRSHPFAMLDSPDASEGLVRVAVELLGDNYGTVEADHVDRYRRAFRALQDLAATGPAAADILDRVSGEAP